MCGLIKISTPLSAIRARIPNAHTICAPSVNMANSINIIIRRVDISLCFELLWRLQQILTIYKNHIFYCIYLYILCLELKKVKE